MQVGQGGVLLSQNSDEQNHIRIDETPATQAQLSSNTLCKIEKLGARA